jgi:NAD(P)-dependent dehydrogenase (short-subunit alcohol dehydrogenase family)
MTEMKQTSRQLIGDPGLPSAQRLAGKVAIISGAGNRPFEGEPNIIGNGKAISITFAREGAKVVLVDQRTDWAEETQSIIKEEGGESLIIGADVTKPDDCAAAARQALDAFGHIDILVNVVGVTGPVGNAMELDPVGWDDAMRVNVASMMLMAKYSLPSMIESGNGSIINISSVSGLIGGHPSLLYPTSKAAIIGLTRGMAAHHGRQGVRVNAIAPGTVYTPMVASRGVTPELRTARRKGTLLETEGYAWDVANAAAFLASDAARWITNVVLPVDAGASATRLAPLAPRSDGTPENPGG